jgi:hypothetical protein
MSDEGDLPEEGYSGNVAGFMARAIQEGRSATSAYNSAVEQGLGIRRQSWFRTWDQVESALASRPEAVAQDVDALPVEGQFQPWAMNRQGLYFTQLLVFQRDRETGLVSTTYYTHDDTRPHTPGEAIDAMFDDFLDATEAGGSFEDLQVIGAVPWGFYQSSPL